MYIYVLLNIQKLSVFRVIEEYSPCAMEKHVFNLTLVASLTMLSQAWFGSDMYFSISLSMTTESCK